MKKELKTYLVINEAGNSKIRSTEPVDGVEIPEGLKDENPAWLIINTQGKVVVDGPEKAAVMLERQNAQGALELAQTKRKEAKDRLKAIDWNTSKTADELKDIAKDLVELL